MGKQYKIFAIHAEFLHNTNFYDAFEITWYLYIYEYVCGYSICIYIQLLKQIDKCCVNRNIQEQLTLLLIFKLFISAVDFG